MQNGIVFAKNYILCIQVEMSLQKETIINYYQFVSFGNFFVV